MCFFSSAQGPAYDLTFSEVRSHSLVLVWKAPVYAGSSAVSGYFVDMAKKGSCEFVALNENTISQRYMQVRYQPECAGLGPIWSPEDPMVVCHGL